MPGDFSDAVPQPQTWVAFRAAIERNAVPVGRFWRDCNGSTRLQWDVADADGRTIVIENVRQSKYYVFRPLTGRTVQPMALPTQGWVPPPMPRREAGMTVVEDGRDAYERVWDRVRERRVALLNFFPVWQDWLTDGTVHRYVVRIVVGDVADALFTPPANATPVVLDEIAARPLGRRSGQ